MDVIAAMIAGIVGIAAMTLLVCMASAMGMPKMDMGWPSLGHTVRYFRLSRSTRSDARSVAKSWSQSA